MLPGFFVISEYVGADVLGIGVGVGDLLVGNPLPPAFSPDPELEDAQHQTGNEQTRLGQRIPVNGLIGEVVVYQQADGRDDEQCIENIGKFFHKNPPFYKTPQHENVLRGSLRITCRA